MEKPYNAIYMMYDYLNKNVQKGKEEIKTIIVERIKKAIPALISVSQSELLYHAAYGIFELKFENKDVEIPNHIHLKNYSRTKEGELVKKILGI